MSEGPSLERGHRPSGPAGVTLGHGVPLQVQAVLGHKDPWHGHCSPWLEEQQEGLPSPSS